MGSKAKYKRKQAARAAAQQAVPKKFSQAAKQEDQAVANRLIRRARRMAMKFRMSLGPYKHHYCEHCYSRLDSRNSRVRVQGGKVIIYCGECKNFRRIQLTPKRKVKVRRLQEEKVAKKKEKKTQPKKTKRRHVKKAAVDAAKAAVHKKLK